MSAIWTFLNGTTTVIYHFISVLEGSQSTETKMYWHICFSFCWTDSPSVLQRMLQNLTFATGPLAAQETREIEVRLRTACKEGVKVAGAASWLMRVSGCGGAVVSGGGMVGCGWCIWMPAGWKGSSLRFHTAMNLSPVKSKVAVWAFSYFIDCHIFTQKERKKQ